MSAKRMHRVLLVLLVVFVQAVMLGCGGGGGDTIPEHSGAYVLISVTGADTLSASATVCDSEGEKTNYTAAVSGGTLYISDVINALVAEGMVFESQDYGGFDFVTKIGTLSPSGSDWTGFYTTSTSLEHSMMEYAVRLGGSTFYSCNYGIGTMPALSLSYLFIVVAG